MKTISPKAAFVKAVKAAPDDDLPRLVFADWLDEHGEPERAAFIRWQCHRPSADGELLDVIAKRKLSPGANCVRFKDCIQTYPWAQLNFADHIGKQPANRVVVVMNKSRSAAVVWHRGFIAAVYCSTVSLTAEAIRLLYGHPVRVAHLRGDLGWTEQTSQGLYVTRWKNREVTFPDAPWSAYRYRPVASEEAELKLLKFVLPTLREVCHGDFTAKGAATMYQLS